MLLKKCHRCKENLYIEEFNADSSTKDGFHKMCRICRRERHRERVLEEMKPIEDLPNENWAVGIENHSGYMISDLGRCKSLRRKHKWHDTILKIAIGKRGYPVHHINDKVYYVHRLIAIYFIPNPLNLPEVNHKDGNKLNYAKSNLEWSTTKDNAIHAHRIGLHKSRKGESNSAAKLTEGQVINIYKSSGRTLKFLAEEYNVSIALISKIRQRVVWKHILGSERTQNTLNV